MSFEYRPKVLLHPGEHWREIIETSGRAQVLIARDLGITEKHLSQIVCCKVLPSVDHVVAFACLMGVAPELLWRIQCNYVLARAVREAS